MVIEEVNIQFHYVMLSSTRSSCSALPLPAMARKPPLTFSLLSKSLIVKQMNGISELTLAKEGLINDIDKLISKFSSILIDNNAAVQEIYKLEAEVSSNPQIIAEEESLRRQISSMEANTKVNKEELAACQHLMAKIDEAAGISNFYATALQKYICK